MSLVDRTTGRVAASTTIDRLPADRDAAVATATHVVAELASEVGARAAPELAEPEDDRATRSAAELRFRREALGFGTEVSVYLYVTPKRFVAGTSRRWYPFQGELRRRLEPVEFYKLVGRTDLVDLVRRRRTMMLGLYWGGASLAIGSAVIGYASLDDSGPISRIQNAAVVGICAGLAAIAAGRWLQRSPQPISENEAKSLAEQYNARLRRQLGLLVGERARPRDVQVAPYVGTGGAGLALATTF